MRKLPIAVLVLLALGSAARAGVYNLSDPTTLFAVYTEGEDVSTPEGRANIITRVEAAARLNGLPLPPQVPARLFELRAAAIEPKGTLDPNSPRALDQRRGRPLRGVPAAGRRDRGPPRPRRRGPGAFPRPGAPRRRLAAVERL